MQELKEKKIFLEMCYSSNLQTKTVERVEDYPLATFLAHGIAVTLNTDNLTVSDTSLQREYALVQNQFDLSDDTLKAIAKNAVDGAFLSAEEKETLKKQIDREFSIWLHGQSKK